MGVLLNEKFHTPYETVPFTQVKNTDFIPDLKMAIEKAKSNIEKIKSNQDRPTFRNVIEALEDSSQELDLISAIFFNLHGAESSDELQKIAKEFSPLVTEFQNDLLLDHKLFEKIKVVYEARNAHNQTAEEIMLIETRYKQFARNGALLSDQQKEKLREIDQKLSHLGLEFGDHVLAETNNYIHFVEKQSELTGLPEAALEAASHLAREKGKEGQWAFTLQIPSYLPVMTYAENRLLRETLFKAYAARCFNNSANDNQQVVKSIVNLRTERANLLGYKTHADFVLEERMAGSAGRVNDFIGEMLRYARPVADKEFEELKKYAMSLGAPSSLERWDVAYYSEKLKKEKFAIDDEVLRPFFKLENVVDGIFKVASKLYDLTFKENKNIPLYHPEVRAFTVERKGQFQGIFYTDFFPRAGKRQGAWMTSFRGQKNHNGKNQRPHISIVCNFTRPTSTKPSLLTLSEVTTLFHEFGHALHGLLANTKYESLSGTSVYWDFVELPSQIMENWVFEKECLDLFAQHYETGEKISQETIKRIKDSSNFQEGLATLRQLSFAALDMAWHSGLARENDDVATFENKIMEKFSVLPLYQQGNASCSFGHIFTVGVGYSAGYYSYKWAEVLDADAFDYFKEKGIFNPEVANKFYDHVLSKGGSEPPMVLYRRFRGKDPSVDALLRRSGLKSV